jgi:hypothetical protein
MPPFRHGEESHSSMGVSHASPAQPESIVTYVGSVNSGNGSYLDGWYRV